MRLDGKLCGLVEGWANGCDWSELVASTSLDQGDLCRILRRAMEMLRQIPVLVRMIHTWNDFLFVRFFFLVIFYPHHVDAFSYPHAFAHAKLHLTGKIHGDAS